MNNNLGLSNGAVGGFSKRLTIVDGTFRLQVSEGSEGAVSRVNKTGKTVYEMVFSSLKGFITDIKVEDSQFGKQAVFTIKADREYTLSFGYTDGIASSIFKMLPNVDAGQPVSIVLNRKMDEVKKKMITSVFVSQDGQTLKHFYNKANPNGLPPFEQIMFKGALTWDNTKQVDFLIANAVANFLTNVRANSTTTLDRPISSVLGEGQGLMTSQPAIKAKSSDTGEVLEGEDIEF